MKSSQRMKQDLAEFRMESRIQPTGAPRFEGHGPMHERKPLIIVALQPWKMTMRRHRREIVHRQRNLKVLLHFGAKSHRPTPPPAGAGGYAAHPSASPPPLPSLRHRPVALDGEGGGEGFLGGFAVGLGFLGEVGVDEELGDFLLFGGEGAEVGDALELFGGEGGLLRGRGVAGEVAGGAGVEGDEAGGGELLDGGPGGFVEDLELRGASPRQSVSWKRAETAAARVGSRRTVRRTGVASPGRMASWQWSRALAEGRRRRVRRRRGRDRRAGPLGAGLPSGAMARNCWRRARLASAPRLSLASARDFSVPSSTPSARVILLASVSSIACSMVFSATRLMTVTGRRLVLAPGAGDALFELGRVPGQVAVDDDAGVLEVEADAAGVGAEEDAAVGIVAEGVDLAAALLLGDGAGVPGVADAVPVGPGRAPVQHAFPLGEDDDLDVGIGEGFVEDALQFVELRAVLAVAGLRMEGVSQIMRIMASWSMSWSCSCLVSGRRRRCWTRRETCCLISSYSACWRW